MYEYKTEKRTTEYLYFELDNLKKDEGWELVSYQKETSGFFFSPKEKFIYKFKRPVDWQNQSIAEMAKEQTDFRSNQAKFWAALAFYRPDLFEMSIKKDKFDESLWIVIKAIFSKTQLSDEERKYKVLLPMIIQKLIKDAAIINPETRDKNNESDK